MTHLMTRLVLQLAMIVISARLLGWFFSRRLRLPKILGELCAGMLIGPFALGSFALPGLHGPLFPLPSGPIPISPELYGFTVVASIILLFSAGLETDLPTFLRFSIKGSLTGLGGVIVAFVLGSLTARLLLPGVDSFMHPTALFLGTLATATSVGITARILSEKRKLSTPEGVTIMAAAVLDDVLGIILLAVVAGVAGVAQRGGKLAWGGIGLVAGKAFAFWFVSTVLGILAAPWLSRRLKRFESMSTVAAVCFGIALFLAGLSEMAGLAMIIGAYVAGLSLSQTDIAHEIREKLHGLHDFMIPVFFAVMGMLVDFKAIPGVLAFGSVYVVVALFSKMIGCGIPALLTGFNARGAFRIGAGMLPRGEVTLIIAGVGLASGAIGPDMFGVAIMTLLVAGIVAPAVLSVSFRGGSGYRGNLATQKTQTHVIDLEFPSRRMADFVVGTILDAFREADFFVHPIDRTLNLYNLRKDAVGVTLQQSDQRIQLATDADNETLVRLLLVEVLLDLKDFVQSIETMKSPDMMGAELMIGMFAQDDAGDEDLPAEPATQPDAPVTPPPSDADAQTGKP